MYYINTVKKAHVETLFKSQFHGTHWYHLLVVCLATRKPSASKIEPCKLKMRACTSSFQKMDVLIASETKIDCTSYARLLGKENTLVLPLSTCLRRQCKASSILPVSGLSLAAQTREKSSVKHTNSSWTLYIKPFIMNISLDDVTVDNSSSFLWLNLSTSAFSKLEML